MTKKKADIGGKRLIGLAPNQWVNWLTQILHLSINRLARAIMNYEL